MVSDAKRQFYKKLLGGEKPTKHDLNDAARARMNSTQLIRNRQEIGELPKEFDARTKWPYCDSIKTIQVRIKVELVINFAKYERKNYRNREIETFVPLKQHLG